jgi:hypothetical protein
MTNALFVDEAGSYWGIYHLEIHSVHGETSLYYRILSIWSSVFGTSEIALRSLSAIAMFGVLALFAVLSTLRSSVVFFYALPLIAASYSAVFSAVLARPYGLGLLVVMFSIVIQEYAARSRKTFWLPFASAIYALALYFHPTFIFIAPAFALQFWQSPAAQPRRRILVFSLVVFGIVAAPAIQHSLSLFNREHSLSFVEGPVTLEMIAAFLIPKLMGVTVLIALATKGLIYKRSEFLSPGAWSNFREGLVWFLSVKLTALIAALLVNPAFLVPRYSLFADFGEVVMVAALLTSIKSSSVRNLMWVGTLTISLAPWLLQSFPDTAWRPAMEYARRQQARNCTLFAIPGFVEAKNFELVSREPTASFIRSPLTYYNLQAELIPFELTSANELGYFERQIAPKALAQSCNLLLLWSMANPRDPGPAALLKLLKDNNFNRRSEFVAGTVRVLHLERLP